MLVYAVADQAVNNSYVYERNLWQGCSGGTATELSLIQGARAPIAALSVRVPTPRILLMSAIVVVLHLLQAAAARWRCFWRAASQWPTLSLRCLCSTATATSATLPSAT